MRSAAGFFSIHPRTEAAAGAPWRAAGIATRRGASIDAPTALPEGTKATPVARRVAAAHGVDLGRVKGSGPAGRIGKDDVLAAANGSNGASATAERGEAGDERSEAGEVSGAVATVPDQP